MNGLCAMFIQPEEKAPAFSSHLVHLVLPLAASIRVSLVTLAAKSKIPAHFL